LLDEKGKIPSFGVLSESAWGKMDSPDGLTWMEGIVDLFDRAIRSRGRLRVGQRRPAMWEDRELGTERMDTLPARLMGSADGGSLLFVVGGKWIAEEGKAPAGEDWYAQIFPFFPNKKAAMDAIALAYKITGANQIQFLLPDPPGTEAPKRDILGVDAFEAYMGGGGKASAKVDWAEAAERLRLSPKMPTVLYPREAFHRYYGVADPKDIEAQQIAAKRWYNAKIIANSTAFIQALRPPGKTSGGIFGYHLPALEELARKHKSKEAARLDKLLRVHVVPVVQAHHPLGGGRAGGLGRLRVPSGFGRLWPPRPPTGRASGPVDLQGVRESPFCCWGAGQPLGGAGGRRCGEPRAGRCHRAGEGPGVSRLGPSSPLRSRCFGGGLSKGQNQAGDQDGGMAAWGGVA
jgi:hypothetical protein